jgi:hypothetical protein
MKLETIEEQIHPSTISNKFNTVPYQMTFFFNTVQNFDGTNPLLKLN